VRALGARALGLARSVPVTLGLLVALWVVAAVTGSLVHGPSAHLSRTVAAGVRSLENGHLWTPLTAAAFAPGLPGYILGTVVVLALCVPSERRLGSSRFALAAVLTQVFGVLLALGVVRLVGLADAHWARELSRNPAVGPTTYAVGVAMVLSAGLGTLWRRRLRVGLLVVLATVMLYGGLLQDVVRFSCALIGLLLGPVLLGRPRRGARLAGTRREGRVLVAIVVAASALGPVLAAFSPTAVGPLSVLQLLFTSAPPDAATVQDTCADPATTAESCRHLQTQLRLSGVGPSILSVLPSLLLVVLSDGLRRGRRAAWVAAVALHVLLVALSVFLLLHSTIGRSGRVVLTEALQHVRFVQTLTIPLVAPLVVLLVLVASRRLFDVAAPRRTYRRLALTAAGLVAALAVLYVVGGLVLGSGFDRRPGLLNLVQDVPQRFVPPGYLGALEPDFLPVSTPATLLFEWTGVVFWAVLAVLAVRSFLRPVTADDSSAGRGLELLRAHGGSHLSWMTTWTGNQRWFTPEGDGFVAYRVLLGVAVTTSDPVCATDRTATVVLGFADFCTANGWTPCFYSVTEPVRAATAALGWGELQVAEETVLPLTGLAFTGKKFQDVRSSFNKAAKEGITAEWLSFPTAPLALTEQIIAISEEWVADKGMPEMGFTLGGLTEVDDPAVRCLVAVDADRTVHGVTSWLPVHREGEVVGWTLDFMRRRTDGFRPAMEFLIASAALLLQEEGAELLSLSGAPLAKIDRGDGGESAPESTVQRLLELLGRSLEPVYGFRSLLAFKSKFQPEHVPLYMTYPDVAALPTIGNAIGRAYLPEVSFGQGLTLVRKLVRSRS
jgi:phosphatidylglycerol lysyltransferase